MKNILQKANGGTDFTTELILNNCVLFPKLFEFES